MIYVALAVVVAFVLWRVVGVGFLRVVRVILYPLYPYCGTFALMALILTCRLASVSVEYTPGELMLLAVADVVFGTLAYAKFVGFLWRSRDRGWWMWLMRLSFGLSAVIFFPIGILAWIIHVCFVAEREQRETFSTH